MSVCFLVINWMRRHQIAPHLSTGSMFDFENFPSLGGSAFQRAACSSYAQMQTGMTDHDVYTDNCPIYSMKHWDH